MRDHDYHAHSDERSKALWNSIKPVEVPQSMKDFSDAIVRSNEDVARQLCEALAVPESKITADKLATSEHNASLVFPC